MLNNEVVMSALEKSEISIDEAIEQLAGNLATDGYGLSIGTVVAIRRPDPEHKGKYITETRSSGYRDWDNTEPVESDDLFRIYSVTKTFTADVIRSLHQGGKLHLDDKLTKWVEEITKKNTKDGHAEWNSALKNLNIHKDATIKDLLLHRSGIGNYSQGGFIDHANSTPHKNWSLYELFKHNVVEEDGVDKNDAHNSFCYSDTGYNLLALIAKHAAGKKYETLVQELCSEADLHKTCFIPQAKQMEAQKDVHLAQGYIINPESKQPASSMDYDTGKGSGGLLSNAEEMLTWAKEFHSRYEEALEKDTMLIVGKTPSRCDDKARYGHGIMIQDNGSGEKLYGHGGYARGGRSKVFYYPKRDISVIVLESFETSTPMIAKELKELAKVPEDINKTTLLLRDLYTDDSGKFNRTQLRTDWNEKQETVIKMFQEKLEKMRQVEQEKKWADRVQQPTTHQNIPPSETLKLPNKAGPGAAL